MLVSIDIWPIYDETAAPKLIYIVDLSVAEVPFEQASVCQSPIILHKLILICSFMRSIPSSVVHEAEVLLCSVDEYVTVFLFDSSDYMKI